MATGEELLQSVKSAVRRAVAAVRAQRPEESLAGFALLTDDGLTTLVCMAVTKEALVLGAGEDLLFSPTDWPLDVEPAAFNGASQLLRALEAGGDSNAHIQMAYAALVQALAEARSEGTFSPGVFLSVLSTDPGPQLERLEDSSVERLNSREVADARRRFLERWAT